MNTSLNMQTAIQISTVYTCVLVTSETIARSARAFFSAGVSLLLHDRPDDVRITFFAGRL